MTWSAIIGGLLIVAGAVVWYVLPIFLVDRHGIEGAVDRSHHENNARKTVGLAMTALGVVVPWASGAYQYIMTQQAQRYERERTFAHDIGKQFSESLVKLAGSKEDDTEEKAVPRVQLIYDLERMALSVNGPPEHFIVPVADNLKRLIGNYAKFDSKDGEVNEKPPLFFRHGCDEERRPSIRKREWKDDMVRAAFGSLGRLRSRAEFAIRLDGLQFDNADVTKKLETPSENVIVPSFNNAHFIGAYFRRADLTGATFKGTDFRKAHFGDREVPGFSDDPNIAESIAVDESDENGDKHRCWIADFRGVVLIDANFGDAVLTGADLRNAKLKGAKFKGADIRRANFKGSDVTMPQLCSAQWDDGRFAPKSDFGVVSRARCNIK